MITSRTRSALLISTFILAAASSLTGQELKKGVYFFCYDLHKPGSIELCEQDTGSCQEWNPRAHFFRSGSLIRLRVLNGRFRSTFKVIVNGLTLADVVPQFRGVSSAPSATQPTSAPTPSPAVVQLDSDVTRAMDQLKTQYQKVDNDISDADAELDRYPGRYLNMSDVPTTGNCTLKQVNALTSTAGDILIFATNLMIDARSCDESTHGEYFRQEDVFNSLTDRADWLITSIKLLNSTLPNLKASGVRSEWQSFQATVTQFKNNFPSSKYPAAAAADTYLPGGDAYETVLQKEEKLESDQTDAQRGTNDAMEKINATTREAFAYINTLYQISESDRTFDLPVGQYNGNYAAAFSIVEVANPVVYSVASAQAPQHQDDSQSAPAPIGNPFGTQPRSFLHNRPADAAVFTPASFQSTGKGRSATDNTQKPCCVAPANASPGNTIFSSSFDVHKIYRGNIVAGFFVSSLENRPYGITNNGQASSSTNITFVTVTGQPYRPQFHAFVGVDVYLWERDVFPEQLSKQGFLWFKKPHGYHGWLNGYWNPGILVGYGVDSTNNYLVGLNWETKWGINVGGGLHVGQESYLQPGIVPGVTQLPNTATSAPTYNKTAAGGYGSVGFDLGVMKSALGQLFGGGSGTGK
jgi:hypothetical protein